MGDEDTMRLAATRALLVSMAIQRGQGMIKSQSTEEGDAVIISAVDGASTGAEEVA
jgi:hypothetical protein